MPPLAIRRRERRYDEPEMRLRSPFEGFLEPWFWTEPETEVQGAYPVDIYEDDDRIYAEAEMPGFKKDEIDISLDRDVLKIRAERKQEERKGTEYVRERKYSRIQRAFSLPSSVDESKINARLEDGILHIEMSKDGRAKPRKIELQ